MNNNNILYLTIFQSCYRCNGYERLEGHGLQPSSPDRRGIPSIGESAESTTGETEETPEVVCLTRNGSPPLSLATNLKLHYLAMSSGALLSALWHSLGFDVGTWQCWRMPWLGYANASCVCLQRSDRCSLNNSMVSFLNLCLVFVVTVVVISGQKTPLCFIDEDIWQSYRFVRCKECLLM